MLAQRQAEKCLIYSLQYCIHLSNGGARHTLQAPLGLSSLGASARCRLRGLVPWGGLRSAGMEQRPGHEHAAGGSVAYYTVR